MEAPIFNKNSNSQLCLSVVRFIEALSKLAGTLAAFLLVTIVAFMLLEILWRLIFGKSLHFTWELSSYAMSGVFLLGASYTLHCGAHVRVTSMLELVPPKISRIMDNLCSLIGLAISGFLTKSLFILALSSFQGNIVSFTINRVPLAYPQSIMALGAGLMTLQFFARLLRQILGLPPDVVPKDDEIPGHE